MPKKLKPLQTHNRDKLADILAKQKKLKGNGIACPDCGKELMGSGQGMVLASLPVQYPVECNKCGFQGLRY